MEKHPRTPVLEVRNITKRFPGVLANDHINLTLYRGQVLGLLGENGAGKSTLMNLIYGLYDPDEGEIRVNGTPVEIKSPSDAIRLGIGMVHQHFQLVDVLTVTENVMLGNESILSFGTWRLKDLPLAQRIGIGLFVVVTLLIGLLNNYLLEAIIFLAILAAIFAFGIITRQFLDRQAARKRILALSQEYGLEVDPDALVADLPVGAQQRVEIIKALYRNADILILDEPTAVLTPQETQGLFKVMRKLIELGVSIIFISHKLKEVLEICDEIVVLRRGTVAGIADPKTSTEQSLASLMVGRDVLLEVNKQPAQPGEPVLIIEELVVYDDRNLMAVDHVSLEVFAGEILGIAGVQGNGQTELVEAITGLREVARGRIILLGKDVTNAFPRHITSLGVGHIPEDRQRDGMVSAFPVMNNLVLCNYHQEPFSHGVIVDEPAIERNAQALVKEYDVRPPNIYQSISGLSGGNQQKVIVAREFSRGVKVLIASQPTRGLDVGSIEFIHKQLIRMRDAGTAILLVSTELDEILSMSDRIAVMFDGRIIDVIAADKADRDMIGLRMTGIVEATALESDSS